MSSANADHLVEAFERSVHGAQLTCTDASLKRAQAPLIQRVLTTYTKHHKAGGQPTAEAPFSTFDFGFGVSQIGAMPSFQNSVQHSLLVPAGLRSHAALPSLDTLTTTCCNFLGVHTLQPYCRCLSGHGCIFGSGLGHGRGRCRWA